MYVTPLYTVIPSNEGFKALKHFLTNVLLKNRVRKPYFICRAELVLMLNLQSKLLSKLQNLSH